MPERWMGVWHVDHAAEDGELQTDVMRFMAILAFCLVAIFAIMQSMPLAPTVEPPRVPAVSKHDFAQPAESKPAKTDLPPVLSNQGAVVTEPELTLPKRRVFSRVVRPANKKADTALPPVDARLKPAPTPGAVQAGMPDQKGLSLRFESDSALKRLVRSRAVSLYAIDGREFWKLDPERASGFTPAPAPAQFHEMVALTVPADVRQAFPRVATWGVTLPDAMTQTLNRLARAGANGELIIAADGNVHIENRR